MQSRGDVLVVLNNLEFGRRFLQTNFKFKEIAMYYDDRCNELTELSSFDESQDYEVDIGGIYLDSDGKFILLTASGCSCWDGDYSEEIFESLEALELTLLTSDGDRWNPSLLGTHQLIQEARNSLAKLKE